MHTTYVADVLPGLVMVAAGAGLGFVSITNAANPIANKPILEWFPSFGPMQFAVGGAFGHTACGATSPSAWPGPPPPPLAGPDPFVPCTSRPAAERDTALLESETPGSGVFPG